MTASHVKIDKAAIARNAVCGDARSTTCGAFFRGRWVWPTSVPDSDISAAHFDCPYNANAEGECTVPVQTAKS